MDDKIDKYLEGLVESIMQGSPRLSALSVEDKEKAIEQLRDRLYKLALETLFNRLSSEQKEDVKKALDNGNVEERVEYYASIVPDFAFDLENRLQREVEFIKNTMS
jgi:DNA-binding GntR family transcriptional regulator